MSISELCQKESMKYMQAFDGKLYCTADKHCLYQGDKVAVPVADTNNITKQENYYLCKYYNVRVI
jgi:hypothetical protein